MYPFYRFILTLFIVFSQLDAQSNVGSEENLVCPDDSYQQMISLEGEAWCFALFTSVRTHDRGLSFDDAVAVCQSKGAYLPIVTALGVDFNLGAFKYMNTDSKDDIWLAIVCDEKDSYVWQDGQPLNYTEFRDPPEDNCTNSQHFAQDINGKWVAYEPQTQFEYCICARRPEPAPSTTEPSTKPRCETGMYEVSLYTGWCYGTIFVESESVEEATDMCSRMYGSSLPSINSQLENDALSTVHEKINVPPTPFWIGLKCLQDGEWYWNNGEPWSGYTNFKDGDGDPENCDPEKDSGHIFNTENEWEDGVNMALLLVCIKRVNAYTELSTPSESDTSDSGDTGISTGFDTAQPITLVPRAIARIVSRGGQIGLPPWGIVAICVVSILIVAMVLLIIIMVWKRFRKLQAEIVEVQHLHKDGKVEDGPVQHSRYYNLPAKSDEWEIERRFVSIDYTHKLGEGAFGSVHLGRVLAKNIPIGMGRSIAELYELTNNNDTVAVKMLHETADSNTEKEFRAEIDLMKAIGFHERLVNILACVTITEPNLLIVEYCANGDLLNFMRERRTFMLENPENTDDEKTMNVKKQIMFAVQIAYGLEYLSSQGFVHRDIAARNILVDQQETCKIGDFGLCRAIGKEEENYHSQGGKLPLKWMSPEAIDNYEFSSASDVWSYGILLFEIVTLGGSPYAGWPASELLHRLKRGERMDRPDNCSENLFEVMSHCWEENPSERPSFTKLRKRLGVLLEQVNQDDYYLKLNAQANYYVLESNASH